MQRLLLFLLISSIISASCASRKKSTPAPVKTEEVKVAPATKEPEKTADAKDQLEPASCVIRLLVPLRLKEHFANDTVPDQPLLYDNTVNALHAYLGAMAAVDSLKELSLKLSVEVVDLSGDSLDIVAKLRKQAFSNANIAISFMPATYNDVAIKAASAAKCRLVLPGASNTQTAINNPFVWYATATNNTQLVMMCGYLLSENATAENIVLTRKTRSENVLAGFIANRLDSLAGKKVSRQVEFTKDKWDEFQKSLPKNKKVNLIIPTQDEAYLQSIINKLKSLEDGYLIRLVGLPSWENFESVDPAVLSEYNTCIFNSMYIDPEHARLQKFRKAFIDLNHVDPFPQAYQAFDLVKYFAINFSANGDHTEKYMPVEAFELPQRGLQFGPVCSECGFENRSLNILRFADYKLSRVTEFQR